MSDPRNNGTQTGDPMAQRYYELLADQCTVGLDADGRAELLGLQQQLMREQPSHDWRAEAEHLALTAAALDQAMAPPVMDDMPAGLADRVAQAVEEQADSAPTEDVLDFAARLAQKKQTHKAGRVQWLGWYAAAASLAAAIYFGTNAPTPLDVQSPAELRASLMQQPGTQVIDWATPTEAGYEQVSGDVVWDNDTQQGFMRLVNLPVNDPQQSQYQLWIVDPDRDQHPVDGGVFDVNQDGEVIIPIDSKLPIISPAAFAITREQPGGVVVSAGPLLVVAAVEA